MQRFNLICQDILGELLIITLNVFLEVYSSWYRDLCIKPPKNDPDEDLDSPWRPGPQLVSTKMRVVPKLLRLTWLGYPLHYDEKYGWGYLVPGLPVNEEEYQERSTFPYEAIRRVCADTKPVERSASDMELQEIEERLSVLSKEIEELEGKRDAYLLIENLLQQQEKLIMRVRFSCNEIIIRLVFYLQRKKLLPTGTSCPIHQGNGPYLIPNVPGCWFFKIPHKVRFSFL